MDDGVAEILEVCLARLASGVSVDECLAAYPAEQFALEAPLRAAAGLQGLPRPAMPPATQAALEAQMLARAAARRASRPVRVPWWRLGPSAILAGALRALGYGGRLSTPWLRAAAAVVVLALALILSAGVYAATRTIMAVFSPPTPVPTAAPVPQTFTFDGVLERADQEAWRVGGRTVLIDAQTVIDGRPVVGALAHVSGVVRADGAWLARRASLAVAPTSTPRPLPTAAPPTLVPATAMPTVMPTALPPTNAPAVAPPKNDGGVDGGDGKDKQCQGQQKGRDQKKCDPKPKNDDKKGDTQKGGDKKDDNKKRDDKKHK